MFGECHAHLFMDGLNYQAALKLHRGHIAEERVRQYLAEYQSQGVSFIRDGGDNLGVSAYAKTIAAEYGIDYRTPIFAIHKNGRYGSIGGKGFDSLKEYRELVKEAKVMISGLVDFAEYGVITSIPLEEKEIQEMVQIAHEEGMAVMAHANGSKVVIAAAKAGVDSIEHGRYLNEEALQALAEHQVIWVPTVVTVKNLRDCGRFPEEQVERIYQADIEKGVLTREEALEIVEELFLKIFRI